MSNREVVIVSYARTAFTRAHKGEFKDTRPDTLAAEAIKAALERAPGLDPADVEDVILGCAMPEGEQGMNVARIAAMLAGLPETVPALTVNRFCSSGLQTISQAAERIMVGAIDVAIAGGTESMTMVPMGGNKASANPEVMEQMPEVYTPMGTTAENVAKKFEVDRARQDAFAANSQNKAIAAWERGFFNDEVIPVTTTFIAADGSAKEITVAKDSTPRPGTTPEGLGKLRPAFNPKGTVTAGNASPLTDGAAAVVLMTKEKADELGLKPMGYYRGFQVAGVAPEIMGIGPVPAIRKLLAKHDMKVEDIDMFEINEAFAAQASYCQQELGIPDEKINPHGGAIAIGHPLGVSGTRMTGTLLRAMAEKGQRWGVVSMCIGGGMGAAGLFEIVD
ncbi:MAG: thiolase family protein [Myxococcota bacterium]|nr:thiolase family protein [Myxococcota bacterium]